ncbi:MAG: RNA 2',3'-cyclic phosphodiesterase, partial [Candidatus Aenigmarchaeota archaeon]|nr:RNA 2',3'-cyclic phosphodiesterase [Candidatus Aenigmarchaeota archaeon]
TVKFIGDVNENEIREIKESLLCSSQKIREFKINIGRVGCFGSESHIRTIWLDINEGKNIMENLMKFVNNNMKMGEYKISPHMTIARVKSKLTKNELMGILGETKDVNIGKMDVKFISLKSSILTSNGPVYNDLAKYKLGVKYE